MSEQLYAFNEDTKNRLLAMLRDFEEREGDRPSRQTIIPRVPTDTMRLVRAIVNVSGGSTGLFQFISGSKGAETDTDEEPIEMWSPPGVDWSGSESPGTDSDQGYALFVDSGWEVARRSCPE